MGLFIFSIWKKLRSIAWRKFDFLYFFIIEPNLIWIIIDWFLLLKRVSTFIWYEQRVPKDEKLQGLITRAITSRIKEKDHKVAHGLLKAIDETMKVGLKFKNEGLMETVLSCLVQCLNLEQIERGRNEKEEKTEPTAGSRFCTCYP